MLAELIAVDAPRTHIAKLPLHKRIDSPRHQYPADCTPDSRSHN